MSHRFFVEEPLGDTVVLRGAQAHQIANVLRLGRGDTITVVSRGVESSVRLDGVTKDEVRGTCVDRRAAEGEPRARVTLALPILRGDRTEEVIEAVTQLGVSRIVPFVSARSVVRSLAPGKRERWQRIARESAETARRGRVPTIDEVHEWAGLFDAIGDRPLVAWEGEGVKRLRDLAPSGSFALVIGPEGGLGIDEIVLAREHGAQTFSLGRRNLRSETAAIAAVAEAMALVD